ncbi:MAG: hypothetical protein JF606_25030 [Burkholderiales bacterium]|jgi:hypothetical protein|nr:hypothetical protein [Burkholderiales bacterium]
MQLLDAFVILGLVSGHAAFRYELCDFDVQFASDAFQFNLGAEDQSEPKVTGDLEAIGFYDVHDVVAKGLLALVGVGHAAHRRHSVLLINESIISSAAR